MSRFKEFKGVSTAVSKPSITGILEPEFPRLPAKIANIDRDGMADYETTFTKWYDNIRDLFASQKTQIDELTKKNIELEERVKALEP